MEHPTLILTLVAISGTLFGWFVHRRYDDLKKVHTELLMLNSRVRNLELAISKIGDIP
jgi:hypothetical protein